MSDFTHAVVSPEKEREAQNLEALLDVLVVHEDGHFRVERRLVERSYMYKHICIYIYIQIIYINTIYVHDIYKCNI